MIKRATIAVPGDGKDMADWREHAGEDHSAYLARMSRILCDAGLPRDEAEIEASRLTQAYARNLGGLGGPEAPPSFAVRTNGLVVRQGVFSGQHHLAGAGKEVSA